MEQVNEIGQIIISHLWILSWQLIYLTVAAAFFSHIFRKSPRFVYAVWFIVLIRLCVPIDFSAYAGNAVDVEYIMVLLPTKNPPLLEVENLAVAKSLSFVGYLFLVWLVCVFVVAIITVSKIVRLFQQVKTFQRVKRTDLLQLLSSCRKKLGVRQDVSILYSNQSPCVLGFFKPKIILPTYMVEGWSIERIEPILLHELTHISRNDFFANLLQIVLQVVYFFHPCVWYINKRIRLQREFICDDMALSYLNKPRQKYVRSILEVLKNNSQHCYPHEVVTGFFQKSFVNRRIQRMLSNYQTTHSSVHSIMLCIFLLCGTLLCAQNSKGSIKINQVNPKNIPISIDVNRADIRDVAAELEKTTGAQITVAQDVEVKISAKYNKILLVPFLARIANKYGLDVEGDDVFFIKKQAKVTMNLSGDLRDAIEKVAVLANKNIIISKEVQGKVSLKLHEVDWLAALKAIVRNSGYDVLPEQNAFRVLRLPEMTLDVKDAKLRDLLDQIKEISGYRKVIISGSTTDKVTIKLENVSWLKALETIANLCDGTIILAK